ncbi:MAG: helix-turn-helix domain-containing protein [Gemmatimonadaceae bacterium]|nr:helix-turn-helix domain-containing protein [Gemmatimonadaceae bacterium]
MIQPVVLTSHPTMRFTTGQASLAHYHVFDICDPISRLSLLAAIAAMVNTASGDVYQPNWMTEPFLRGIAEILRGINLHINQLSLATRLGVSPSTVRKWFAASSHASCRRTLLCMRSLVVARELHRTADSASTIAYRLGFEHAETMCRMLRQFGICTIELRQDVGFRRLEALVQQELGY